MYAGFLGAELSPAQADGLLACKTDVDEFCLQRREYYWLCRVRSIDSKVWTSPRLRALKLPSSSMRNLTTIRKLAALYPVPKMQVGLYARQIFAACRA